MAYVPKSMLNKFYMKYPVKTISDDDNIGEHWNKLFIKYDFYLLMKKIYINKYKNMILCLN